MNFETPPKAPPKAIVIAIETGSLLPRTLITLALVPIPPVRNTLPTLVYVPPI